MSNIIKVGIADLKVVKSPDILTTIGLGSCVGICFWDFRNKVAGLAHIMLPTSKVTKPSANLMKYADTGIDIMLKDMIDLGGKKVNIISKIAGGAHMFSSLGERPIKVGDTNVAAVKEKLKELHIEINAEDIGADYGRTIELHSETGKLIVKTATKGVLEL